MEDTRFSVSIQIMMTLAYHQNELLSSEALASTLKTNATFIRKLVSHLVSAGLIDSFRGKSGGIKLAKLPNQISLKDIYEASTETKKLLAVHQKPVLKHCPVSCCIEDVVQNIADDIEKTTKQYLSKKYLSDLMKKV
jgi:Rrf2 family protein